MAGTRGLRNKLGNETAIIPFDVAKQEAMRYISLGKEKPGCSVKKVDTLIGKGLFAEKKYSKGEFIVEYAGELLCRREGLKREKSYPLQKGSYIYFFLWNSKKYCLDATNSTRQGRYANDAAEGDVHQNAVMKCIPNEGKPHLALFATKSIGVGEEVRYDYGVPDLPWRKQNDAGLSAASKKQERDERVIERSPVVFIEKLERSLVWQQTSYSVSSPEDSRTMQRTERVDERCEDIEPCVSAPSPPVLPQVKKCSVVLNRISESICEKFLGGKELHEPTEDDSGPLSESGEELHVPTEDDSGPLSESGEELHVPTEDDSGPLSESGEELHVPTEDDSGPLSESGEELHVPTEDDSGPLSESGEELHVPTEDDSGPLSESDDSCIDFIKCGRCKGIFSSIEIFLEHKKNLCGVNGKKCLGQTEKSPKKSEPKGQTEKSPEKSEPKGQTEKSPKKSEPKGQTGKSQKKSRPKRPCPFCEIHASRLTDHIMRRHKTEERVKNALSLPKELRDREFDRFKKEGILKANAVVLSQKNPDFTQLLHERKPIKSTESVMCSLCRGFFSKRRISRHKTRCAAAEGTTEYPSSCSVRILKPDPGFSDDYRQEILECFHETEVGKLIREDDWIKRYGFLKFQNFLGTEKRAEKRRSLMSNLRRLAHLYLEFKKYMKEENPSVSFKSCREMFNRDYILEIQAAIIKMTTHSDDTVKIGLKVSLRYLITDICRVMKANCYLAREDEEAEEMKIFLEVLQVVWPSFFASAEESVIKKRHSVLRRPERLPSEEDVEELRNFTKELIEELSADVYEYMEYNKFTQLRDAVVCRLTLFNARRGGEPSRMTLKDWDDAMNGVWIDQSKVEQVNDQIEKKLLCETKIVYIHASKVAKLVPLLIPKDCWQAIKILTDIEVHRQANINEKNDYIFPSINHSLNYCTGWICVTNVCKKAGLKRFITATDMRHYIATLYSLLDVSPADRDMLYKHLGHSKNINETVYQTPLAVKTITTVGKFLNSLESNTGKQVSTGDDNRPGPSSESGKHVSTDEDNRPGPSSESGSLNLKESNGAENLTQAEAVEVFLCEMAEDVPVSELFDLSRQIQEEEVTVDPEILKESRTLMLSKDVQECAQQYFTEDAWLVAENTLKMLEEMEMPRQSKEGTSTGQTKGLKRKLCTDHASLDEVPGPSREKISKKSSDPEFVEMEEDTSYESSSEDEEEIDVLKGEKGSKVRRKHTWLPQEDRTIEHFFRQEINEFSKSGNQGSLHGVTKKIRAFISKYPDVLKEYPDKVKVHKIRTKVINLRRQSRKKYRENMQRMSR